MPVSPLALSGGWLRVVLTVLLRLFLQEDGALPYDLFAVLVHRGTAAFGHYYAYIKDFATGQWCEFNDGTVVGKRLHTLPTQAICTTS